MINFLTIFLCISIFIIFWGMIGYPISLKIINQFIKKQINKDYTYKPSVTIMIVAHNEEKVIEKKLNNVLSIKLIFWFHQTIVQIVQTRL